MEKNRIKYEFNLDKELKREKFQKILSFYLFKPPLKDVSSMSLFFSDYGWNKNNYKHLLNLLEETVRNSLTKLSKINNITSFNGKRIKSNNIKKEGILFIACSNNEEIEKVLDEVDEEKSLMYFIFKYTSSSKLESIFRHIRNSFAHGNFYIDSHKNYHLEDYHKDHISAKILIPENILLSWIDIIKNKK